MPDQPTTDQSTTDHPTTGGPAPGAQLSTGAPEDGHVVHGGHGTSLAAWVVTFGVLLGTLLVCLALIFMWVPVIVIGAVVIVASALAGPVLVRAGYGEHVPNREFTGGPRAVR